MPSPESTLASPPSSAGGSRVAAYSGTLLVIGWLVGRDVARHGADAGLVLAGAVALAVAPLLVLDQVLAWVPVGRLPERWLGGATRWVRLASLAVAPIVLLVWISSRALHAEERWMLFLPPATLVVLVAFLVIADRLAPRLVAPDRGLQPWLAVAATGALLGRLYYWVHSHEGTLLSMRPGTERLHVALFAATALVTATLPIAALLRVGALRAALAPGKARPLGALAFLCIGLVLIEADRRALVDLYEGVHIWLGATGFLALDAAARTVAASLPRRAGRVLGAAGAVALVALGAGFWIGRHNVERPDVRAVMTVAPQGWIALGFVPPSTRRPIATPDALALLQHPRYHDVPAPEPRPNLLLISVDALRADQMGPPARNAPRLSALAAESVRFRRAYCPGSRTALSMSALHLGRYSADIDWQLRPYVGGKLVDPDDLGERVAGPGGQGRFVYTTTAEMPPGATLAERLAKAGYHTMAAPYAGKNRFFAADEAFSRGFDEYVDLSERAWRPPTSAKITDEAVRLLAHAPPTDPRPWFLWLHYYDPHESHSDGTAYDRLVHDFDDALGTLVDLLRGRGDWDRTVVVLLADHGEAFGEHGQGGHATSLYDEQARVPFLVRLPGVMARDEPRPVSTIDAAATLLALGGARLDGVDGVNLTPLMRRRGYPKNRPIFTELHRYISSTGERTADLKAVVLGDLKLIVDRRRDAAQLFNLRDDPGELENIARDAPEDYARLNAVLDAFLATTEARHPLP